MTDFKKLLENAVQTGEQSVSTENVVLKGQYKKSMTYLSDALDAKLTPALVGPPGTGKTLISRVFAQMQDRPFFWMTMDEGARPAHLLGSFDPAQALQKGFVTDAFVPGPLLQAMLHGGILLINEINRATEFLQNSLLEPLEERSTYVPHIGRVQAADGFFLMFAMNPSEMAGTHRVSEALRDRIKVWVELSYPDKGTELSIIQSHCPEASLGEESLDRIHRLLNRTRNHEDIEVPASVRAGIALARLAHAIAHRDGAAVTSSHLEQAAALVIPGSVKPRPGVNEKRLIEGLLGEVFA